MLMLEKTLKKWHNCKSYLLAFVESVIAWGGLSVSSRDLLFPLVSTTVGFSGSSEPGKPSLNSVALRLSISCTNFASVAASIFMREFLGERKLIVSLLWENKFAPIYGWLVLELNWRWRWKIAYVEDMRRERMALFFYSNHIGKSNLILCGMKLHYNKCNKPHN